MKSKVTVLLLFVSLWSFAQTTVQFSETHQFFDPSEKVIHVTIVVNNINAYKSDTPIILEVFSDLDDPKPLGITSKKGADRTIFPGDYTNGTPIQLPVNVRALGDKKTFTLYLRKKGRNDQFKISQNSHAVIIDKSVGDRSYVGISPLTKNEIKEKIVTDEKIEIPFRIETKGYIPNETDGASAKVNIKGIAESIGLNDFILAGAASVKKLLVEKSKNPEAYERIAELLNGGGQLELEISEITNNSQHQIAIDPSEALANFSLANLGWADASYSFHLGTNFEFSTTFEARDIYYQVDISLYNLFKSRWGVKAGMYKNTTSRYLEDFMLRPTHYELVGETVSGRIYDLIQTGMAPSIATESLGFYFNLPFKVIDSDRFNVFISPHFELIERREKYTYGIVYQDVLTTEITVYDLDFSTPRPLPKEVNSKYWESYFGLGFPMLYNNPGGDFQVSINPIIGAGYPGPYAVFTSFYTGIEDYNYIQIVDNDPGPLPFSAFQFNININPRESFGIKLGSDIRKYFGNERKPIVTINLSTKLDFAQLFNLTGG